MVGPLLDVRLSPKVNLIIFYLNCRYSPKQNATPPPEFTTHIAYHSSDAVPWPCFTFDPKYKTKRAVGFYVSYTIHFYGRHRLKSGHISTFPLQALFCGQYDVRTCEFNVHNAYLNTSTYALDSMPMNPIARLY